MNEILTILIIVIVAVLGYLVRKLIVKLAIKHQNRKHRRRHHEKEGFDPVRLYNADDGDPGKPRSIVWTPLQRDLHKQRVRNAKIRARMGDRPNRI